MYKNLIASLRLTFFYLLFFTAPLIIASAEQVSTEPPAKEETTQTNSVANAAELPVVRKTIRSISIRGNNLVTQEALLARIPFHVGEPFNPAKTGEAIRNLYALHYFNMITIDVEDWSDTEIALIINVEEKKKIESIIYEGNKNLSTDEIDKKLKLSDIPAMDEEELEQFADQIKRLYAEKNYHAVSIQTELRPALNGTYTAIFRITEGPQAVVKRIFFKGNRCVSGRVLRGIIFTREDWLFGFLSKAGSYQPEMLDADKYIIENYYQSNGFLAARVVDIQVDTDPKTQCISITYTVEEGDIYTIASVSSPGNELIAEDKLLNAIPLKPGQLYSREYIRQSMEMLRTVWGQCGYIYADIEPVIVPNFEKKTVDVTFNVELGNKVFLNRITIRGNEKTRDYVIRRMLTLCEGQMLTTPAMDLSKARVEGLGYFDPQNGVEWKINKISEDQVDLDLMLKEAKTGKIDFMMGYGGMDPQSPSTSFQIGGGVSDRNLFGTGIYANIIAKWSRQDRNLMVNIFQPWLFDRPIGAGIGLYHRKSVYEDFRNVNDPPVETLTGGDAQLKFNVPYCPEVQASTTLGIERIDFQNDIRAQQLRRDSARVDLIQSFINRRFISGTNVWLGSIFGQDLRNNPVFPNRGYNWSFTTRLGVPAPGSCIGYFKADFDATWLTPLIGEYDLIFLLHGHAGFVKALGNKLIPYRDLYNMGGPGTVRGFDFGQIGPQVDGSSVGATKAFWINAELIFSVTQDQAIRGVLFYDGGAGWDTPLSRDQQLLLANPVNANALTNNRFRYRHAVGFGIRLLRPAPVRIDWGFKLDRNKRAGEKFYEVHFAMQQEF